MYVCMTTTLHAHAVFMQTCIVTDDYFLTQNSGSASAGVSYLGASGSVSLDISVFDLSVSRNTEIGNSLIEVIIGSDDQPVPIWTKIVPIVKALDDNLWSSNESASIQQKRNHLDRALKEYVANKNAEIAAGKCNH